MQHAGVVLGIRGTADHIMRGFPAAADGYAGSLSCAREVSAVTGACLTIGRGLYEEVGGFDERFATHYQDVDLCLRLRRLGRRNLFTPRAVVRHDESATRGDHYDQLDRALLLDAWGETIAGGDPYYSRWLSLAGRGLPAGRRMNVLFVNYHDFTLEQRRPHLQPGARARRGRCRLRGRRPGRSTHDQAARRLAVRDARLHRCAERRPCTFPTAGRRR